jgi:hypothetical protein
MWVNLFVALLVGFAITMLANLATTIYLHRTLAHRSMTMRPGLSWFFRLVVWLTVGIKPRQWVAVHRKHHAFTDVEGDPHSPVLLGWVRVQLTNVALYRKVANDPEQVNRYAQDLPPDKWDRMCSTTPSSGSASASPSCASCSGRSGASSPLRSTRSPISPQWSGERCRAPLRPQALRELRDELAVARIPDRGRGAAQQPPRRPDLGQAGAAPAEIDPAWWFISVFRRLGWVTIRLDKVVLARCLQAAPRPDGTVAAIAAAKVVTPTGVLERAVVDVDDSTGLIVDVGPTRGSAPDRLLSAGFVDIQVNGIDDVDVAHASGADWDRLDDLLAGQGTTTWCPTLVTAPLDSYAARLAEIALAQQRPPQRTDRGCAPRGPFLGGAGAIDASSSCRPISAGSPRCPTSSPSPRSAPKHFAVDAIGAFRAKASSRRSATRPPRSRKRPRQPTPARRSSRTCSTGWARSTTGSRVCSGRLTDGRLKVSLIATSSTCMPPPSASPSAKDRATSSS